MWFNLELICEYRKTVPMTYLRQYPQIIFLHVTCVEFESLCVQGNTSGVIVLCWHSTLMYVVRVHSMRKEIQLSLFEGKGSHLW